MTILSEGARLATLASQLGKATLHHLHPDEFEYYAMALELCDSRGEQVAYLLLPVMPDSISISGRPLSTITKTQAGLVRLVNPSYNPEEISLSGSFGRRLRLLVRKGSVDLSNALVRDDALGQHIAAGTLQEAWQSAKQGAEAGKQIVKSFSYTARTGYGTCKLLEGMLRAARQPDAYGQPPRLFLYNLAFNYHVLVEEVGFTFTQSMAKNMIWDYQLALRSLAPAEAVQGRLGVRAAQVLAMTADLVQRGATTATNIALDVAQRAQAAVGNGQLAISVP
jgi:hypothetical protein